MKSLLMKLGVVWIMLTSLLSSAFSQGVLVIEISDTLNAPLSGYYVRIKDSNGTVQTYKTDSEGRINESNFPVGDYTYSFTYGDYSTGGFTVKSGEYTWVNLDYRRVAVNFKDEKGQPASGNFVTLYKREDDGTRTLVAQKTSGDDGQVLFVVPEGNYTWVAADGEHDIVVSDKNINTTVSVSSKLVTHTTSFRFVKNGQPISLYAKDVTVYQSQNGKFNPYGIVLAQGNTQANGYVEYKITDGKISCPVGEYQYSVYTKEYGLIEGIFYVTQQNSETNNIVDIVIVEKNNNGGNNGGGGILPPITPIDSVEVYDFWIHVTNCETGEPVSNLTTFYTITDEGRSKFLSTDKEGYAKYSVKEGKYNANIPGQVKEDIYVDKDTIIDFCVNEGPGPDFQYVYFKFIYNGEEVFPQTISRIDIDKIENGTYYPYGWVEPVLDSVTGLYTFKDPLVTIEGKYFYSFKINEFDATYRSGNFTTDNNVQINTIEVVFEKKVNVDVYVIYEDSTAVNGSYNITYVEKYKNSRRTDEDGHLQLSIVTGEYTFSALDQTTKFDLQNDTTIYFILPKQDSRNVFFKFLHDGEEVYPNVTTLSFYRDNSIQQFAYLSSSLIFNYKGMDKAYVFDKPIVLPADTFTASYYINDYEFDGQMEHTFYLNNSLNDTTIYIVVPVKRTVEIQIKDSKGANVQGVFAKIYKYEEDGNLNPYLEYDGNSHSKLMSDATGVVRDHLVPGRYQIRILDIVRDFEVTDYDLRFTILSNVDMFNVKFTVLYKDDESPVSNLKFDFKKGNEFYNNAITDENGQITFQSEAGNYSYLLYYGTGISKDYKITKDEEFIIYIDRPVLVKTIVLIGGEQCLKPGESTKFTAIITPSNATQKNLEWSIDNNVIAKVSSDGTLTANTIGLSGVVTLTAKAKDDSGVVGSIMVNIGEEECVKSYTLAFGDMTTEMWLDDYVFDLVVTPTVDKLQYYVYQTSQDGVNWTTAADMTQETTVTIDAEKYMKNGVYLFRTIAADDAYAMLRYLDGNEEIPAENITNIILLHYDKGEETVTDKIMIPTVFTPHEVNGANDDFMPGYKVVIYNRFGDVICKSDNGWNGKYKGETADAGVYIYVLTLKDGREMKGTIQLYRK